MGLDIKEGEELTLPCKHCASVSLTVVVKAGAVPIYCPKCARPTRVTIAKSNDTWSVQTYALENAPKPPPE